MPLLPFLLPQGAVQALAAAGDMLFSAGQDATLRVWKLDGASNQWQCVAILRQEQGGHRAPIAALWASHPFLFSADYLGTLKVQLGLQQDCRIAAQAVDVSGSEVEREAAAHWAVC